MTSIQDVRAQLRRRLEKLDEERNALLRRITTLDEVCGELGLEQEGPATTPDIAPETETYMRLSDALDSLARTTRSPMKAMKYREQLPRVGFTREVSYENVYTTLSRLVERGRLARTEDARFGTGDDVKAVKRAASAARASWSSR